ncbi:MAG: amino acid ABC transporter permease, partial [Planctomycetes bacterium]|nr:amino acid ABC transporter permease [Planctomycetota bacterium]
MIFCRQQDRRLRDALNDALVRLADRGDLRRVYERYGLWSATQEELPKLMAGGEEALGFHATRLRGWDVIVSRGPILLQAAGMTVFLACASMPLAIIVGLTVAIGRMYGPAPLRWLLVAYVEVLRGTPLMLQLFVIYFLLPEIGIHLQALPAAILGLAINYSAYEAEIYRAGLQAIPRGQMEAALALGMSKGLALRRIIVPQAVRIVIP